MQASEQYMSQVAAIEATRLSDPMAREVFENFNAQIGEVGWHSVHVDGTMDAVSDAHAAEMLRVIQANNLNQPRILEIGAYAHHSSHIVASQAGGIGVSHDISKASLLEGSRRAKVRGFECHHIAVAGDFHDLPFNDGWFDLVFVASSVHHTWRPWKVMEEMLRVVRPGGIVHISNEPIGRTAGLYAFRGNRANERSAYENGIESFGLTATISSPFPGSRAEALFGIIENDRIPFHVYQDTLLRDDIEVKEWNLDFGGTVGPFENWLMETMPSAIQIHDRLTGNLREIAGLYTNRDSLSGFRVPTDDELWPLCYHLERSLQELATSSDARKKTLIANLFGGALTATLKKRVTGFKIGRTNAPSEGSMFKRSLMEDGEVYRDLPRSSNVSLDLENALGEGGDVAGFFNQNDWVKVTEESGIETLCNINGLGSIDCKTQDGVLILRTYSVAVDKPYFFDVLVNDVLAYSHCVTASESHLAKCIIRPGAEVRVRIHGGDLVPLNLPYHSRIIARYIAIEAGRAA